ncbi:hypothetical protein CMV_011737 [Castanea mollissima]|uniref:Uncharacterized protein n=1 Tax=Castanea mollissima TaxID=60419 RepID=A0A8J4R3E8_9ROSI|nr:hypothetical protein CMV_011737 [Castanea mollissima]
MKLGTNFTNLKNNSTTQRVGGQSLFRSWLVILEPFPLQPSLPKDNRKGLGLRFEQEFLPGEWLGHRVVIGCLVEQPPFLSKEGKIGDGAMKETRSSAMVEVRRSRDSDRRWCWLAMVMAVERERDQERETLRRD